MQVVFKNSAQVLPVLVIAALLLIPTIINQDYRQTIVGPATIIIYPLMLALVSIIYASFLWTFISTILGIYKLGKYHLKLAPFYLDNTLGLKPLGNLSMQMSLVYFAGVFLILMQVFIAATISLSTLVEIAILIVLGVTLFFLPLYSAHKKLVEVKKGYLQSLSSRLNNDSFGVKNDNDTIFFKNLSKDKAIDLIAYDIIEQKLSQTSEWPIDPAMVRTLTALAISAGTTIGGRLLLSFMGI